MPSSAHLTPITQASKVYRVLCLLLSGQTRQVDWTSFTAADWELLPQIAQAEGVAPLLHGLLTRGVDGDFNLPPAVYQKLAQSYYHNTAYNAMLCCELDGALDALNRAGVPVILLKGAALIKTLYTDPAERSMNDLDILVRRGAIHKAARALCSAGYQHLADNYIRYHVLMLGGQAGRVTLELHWSLVFNDERFPALIDWFWRQSRPLDPANPLALTLSPAAQLLYLAAHLALQHSGEARLSWYYDLYLLITQDEGNSRRDPAHGGIDWEELLQQAGRAGWAEALHRALTGAQARFNFDLPDGMLERLTAQAQLESGQAGRLVGSPADQRSTNLHKSWAGLGWHDRLRMLVGLLLPRPAYLRWRYRPHPGWLWPLCYVKRWRDLFTDDATNTVA